MSRYDENPLPESAPLTREFARSETYGPEESTDTTMHNRNNGEDMLLKEVRMESQRDALHLVSVILGLSDIDSCVMLDEVTFPPHQRCSREKVCREFYARSGHTNLSLCCPACAGCMAGFYILEASPLAGIFLLAFSLRLHK